MTDETRASWTQNHYPYVKGRDLNASVMIRRLLIARVYGLVY